MSICPICKTEFREMKHGTKKKKYCSRDCQLVANYKITPERREEMAQELIAWREENRLKKCPPPLDAIDSKDEISTPISGVIGRVVEDKGEFDICPTHLCFFHTCGCKY